MSYFYKIILSLCLLILCSAESFSQGKNVGFGTNSPHPSAILHVYDDDLSAQKGVKIPYTDTNAVNAYANSFTPPVPIANGLLIFQKGAETFYYYDGPLNKWIPLSGVTGPTGIKGMTGLTGATGPVGFGSDWRYGNGGPINTKGDTCGDYYIDMISANVWKFSCPGGWGPFPLAGSFKNNILGGETVHLTSLVQQTGPSGAQNTSKMLPINGLNYQVSAPPGYSAMAWIHAWGTVRKIQNNNDYNYAKFDIYTNNPPVPAGHWQVVTIGPTGAAPTNHQELVKWSISFAKDMGPGERVEVFGAQQIRTVTGLGDIILAGPPGSEEEAHLEIMVVYVKN